MRLWHLRTLPTKLSSMLSKPTIPFCNDRIDWVAASPDGFIPEHVSPGAANVIPERLIEVKCPFQRRLDATIVPLSYWIQMQIQMEVCNIDLCDFFEVRMREYWSEGDFLGDFFTPDWHRGVYLMVDEAKRRNWENAVWSTQEGSLLGPDPEMIPTSHESDPMNHHHAVMDAHGREESRLALESTETTVSSPPATVILPPNDIVRPQDLCNWAHSLLRQPYPPRPSTESRGDSSAVHPTERTFSDFFSPKFYHVEAFDIKTVTRDQPWFAHVRSVLEQSATDLRSRLKSINAGMSVEELGVELSENETDAEDSPANSITDSSGYMTSRSDATSLVFEEPQIVETVGQTESGLGDPDRAFGQDSSSLGVSPDDSATLTFTKRRRRSRKAASSGCEGDVSNDPLLEPVPPEMPLEPTPSSDGRERSKRVAKTPFGKVTKEDTPTPSPDARKRSKHGAKGPSTMKASSAKDEAINSGDTIQNSTGKRRKRSSPEPESPFSSSVEGVSQTLQSGVRENTRGAHSSADTNVKRQRRNKRAKHEVAESLPLDVVTDFEPEDPVVLSIVSKRRKRSAVEVASTRARSKTIIADGHPVGQSTKSKTSLKKKFRIPPLTDTRIGMSEEQAVFHAVRFIEGAKA
ncbi:hypothetical protein M427DRAFT_280326 [Gonapodya prolifera JEL478]|uniref:YqaJ viral recombinase domain-containing protein n=1 Tax=Gonapodya prolifera (strain JEL478) TaxID=1344416 RepID=A0A139AYN2_GONPJ|nr:hypothetical protein M427DRAFT_280326 [Gonapodya prolifera JEL478]|eukprot:KXS21858.1 hypothetical protein M427DRAFT_280326 [Gonapodya prolifera JEL478]